MKIFALSVVGPRLLFVVLCLGTTANLIAQDSLRKRIDDKNGIREDVWIYNDIQKAMNQARLEKKPIFVTFRCVPCKACASFDAEVAKGSEKVRKLAKEKFISVRQVEMKNVDLSLFQFDHDLNWAAMFINADGVVYARYGTQSAEGPDAYNSIDGLLHTMERVLELHAEYPKNIGELSNKRGKRKKGLTALKMRGMKNANKLEQQTTRANCVHCHMIHDAEHFAAQELGKMDRDLLWKYPLPDTLGLSIDKVQGDLVTAVQEQSPSAAAGFQKGERIRKVNDQAIASIADIQFALNSVPNDRAVIRIESDRGSRSVKVEKGWKEYDISWRGSMWSVSPMLRVWAPNLEDARLKSLDIRKPNTAFLVRWINRQATGGKSAFESGLRQGDIIVSLEGKPIQNMNSQQFNAYIKLNYQVGDSLPITVLRKGKRVELKLKLAE